ncbi:hypothetical protein N7532_003770 [Penicillium argentinense]|uniref:Uncharacterized protein n=1 Tax=Penicillium argentinense TaxID=1131581 RepID=A0A9W9FN23_9EURO|nr:uncharacterized protein N7532_003770 [Penicillium argentinense]KAJ5103241.1 hypothetical protein N7532_003770 [Penicillium argentinense]
METRLSCRKRRNSAISESTTEVPVSHRTRQSAGITTEYDAPKENENASTPRKSRKRVRFSDPGPLLQGTSASSTGLTPAMRRTSFDPPMTASDNQTPSRKARRRSAPTRRRSLDPVDGLDEASERVRQFTPLRQILDRRTQRRIRRFGLSDEINQIEREKREYRNFEKSFATLRQERDDLRRELGAMKQRQSVSEVHPPSYEPNWRSISACVPGIGNETMRHSDEVSVTFSRNQDRDEDSTFTLSDSAIIVSNSPDLRAMRDCRSTEPDSLMIDQAITDVSTQTSFRNHTEQSDMHDLTVDLEAARAEKEKLFNACRTQIAAFEDSEIADTLRLPSPPSDFFDNIVNILTTALSRASDATVALEGINKECSNLGFSGTSADELVSDMRRHFRSARLELERAVPGETPDVGLEDGKATLGALVKRVSSLARDLQAERKHHHGSHGREKALRGQFDKLLYRYEAAANKIDSLEDSIASSASDMLHNRMRLQDLENEDQEKAVGIDRLSTALEKYRDDMKGLENLVSRLEDENVAAKEKYKQQIAKLRYEVAHERKKRSAIETSASGYETRIRQLEETVEQNRIHVCDLMAHVEMLEKEQQIASDALEKKAYEQMQQHEQETGALNVRISELNTSLEEKRLEANRLRQLNAGLEDQLRMEVEARDELLDKWAAEQARSFAFMKESVNSERRRAKVRAANWELKSDDFMSDGIAVMGSEPITPVSMTRFVDVEYGRGKNRKRMDSGIGILSEEELLSDEIDLRREIDSDIDLPTSDFIDV